MRVKIDVSKPFIRVLNVAIPQGNVGNIRVTFWVRVKIHVAAECGDGVHDPSKF